MSTTLRQPLDPNLYEQDETAWLDQMADLVRERRTDELDLDHLAVYLQDMANRDRREVVNRLIVLMTHRLKWTHQPEQRSASWKRTIFTQRTRLEGLIGQGVLRNHAQSVIDSAYRKAVQGAALEIKRPIATFPPQCPYTLENLLTTDPADD